MLPHIERELSSIDFDLKELEVLLAEGQELYERKKMIEQAILAHPGMKKTPLYYSMTRAQKMEFVIKQTSLFHKEIFPSLGFKEMVSNDLTTMQPALMGVYPFSTHLGMFTVQIEALGTKEQADYWVPKCKSFEVLGCYAQTELAHGSDVQGIQTTSKFDLKSDQFVIHTPSLEAAKYWPGDMSKIANHTVVIARLIVKDQDYGPQSFIVPIRDPITRLPAKGVEMGDVGSKYGYQNKDNAYAIFTSC